MEGSGNIRTPAFVPTRIGTSLGVYARVTMLCSDWVLPDSGNVANAAIRMLSDTYAII